VLYGKTIVLVEDHDEIRGQIGTFLRQSRANVILASSAVQGLEAIKVKRPDLVISDISMDGMDGFELLRQIRLLAPDAGGSVPVIALTALGGEANRARILNAGFQAWLPKPFSPGDFLRTILTVLNLPQTALPFQGSLAAYPE
jgi:DNA-binding response OmpR family regulator